MKELPSIYEENTCVAEEEHVRIEQEKTDAALEKQVVEEE